MINLEKERDNVKLYALSIFQYNDFVERGIEMKELSTYPKH